MPWSERQLQQRPAHPGTQTLREFEMRVVFQMSAGDSSGLIDSPLASKLGMHRAFFHSEEQRQAREIPALRVADRCLAARVKNACRKALGDLNAFFDAIHAPPPYCPSRSSTSAYPVGNATPVADASRAQQRLNRLGRAPVGPVRIHAARTAKAKRYVLCRQRRLAAPGVNEQSHGRGTRRQAAT